MINLIPSRQLPQQPQSETGDRGSNHGDNRGFFSDDERGKVLFGVTSKADKILAWSLRSIFINKSYTGKMHYSGVNGCNP
jgi:hypothetical protein